MRIPAARARGFSLIELMIAVSLGLLAVAAVGSVFIYGSRSYKEDDKLSRMQDELRFAMAQLSQDLEMAGFYAQVRNPLEDIEVDGSATIANDCGPTTNGAATSATNNWTYQERRAAVFAVGDVDGTEAEAAFPCIDEAELYTGPQGEGTDVIALKRLGGSPVATEVTNSVYLKTNGVQTSIYKKTGAIVEPTSGSIEVYEFKPAVWYLRKYAVAGGPQVPSLCRKYLKTDASPFFETECLAQGIEDLQIELGVDNNANGVADIWTEPGSVMASTTDFAKITAVRIHLLGRAFDPDVNYINRKTYRLTATVAHGPLNDKYHRKLLSSIVLLRNPTNQQTPQELPQ
jgi:type IV pilus assembly protein PilW